MENLLPDPKFRLSEPKYFKFLVRVPKQIFFESLIWVQFGHFESSGTQKLETFFNFLI